MGNLLIGRMCPSISNASKEAALYLNQTQEDHGNRVVARCSQGCQVLTAGQPKATANLLSSLSRASFHDNRIKVCGSGVSVQYYSPSGSTLEVPTPNALLSLRLRDEIPEDAEMKMERTGKA